MEGKFEFRSRARAWRLGAVLERLRVFAAPPPILDARGPEIVVPESVRTALLHATLASRESVLDPLGLGREPGEVGQPRLLVLPFLAAPEGGVAPVPAKQLDETACGPAVLAMLALAGNPKLALRVAMDPTQRFIALQLRAQAAIGAVAAGWPGALGTPPWAAARVARYGTVRYTHRVVGTGRRGASAVAAAIEAATHGTPTPLFTGGDVGHGLATAVPRHVVLLCSVQGGLAEVYEPARALRHTLPAAWLAHPLDCTAAEQAILQRALGNWPHISWVLVPRSGESGSAEAR